MRFGIIGDLYYSNWEEFVKCVGKYRAEMSEIVFGDSLGVAALAKRFAQENRVPYEMYVAERHTYGNVAEKIRDQRIARNVDVLFVFPVSDESLCDTIKSAQKLRIPVVIC